MTDALKPFRDYANLPGFDKLPDDMPITQGSRIAARQLTAGDLRALLAALTRPAGERPAVAVEKLEWGQHDPRRDVWFAETPFGDYFVGNEASGVFRWKFSPAWPWSEDFYATADAAKAAAQADYERRIGSALTAEPQAVPEGMVMVPLEFLDFIKNAPVSSGTCCCGNDMEKHPDPMSCGHTPVDRWDYSLAKWLEQIPTSPTDGGRA